MSWLQILDEILHKYIETYLQFAKQTADLAVELYNLMHEVAYWVCTEAANALESGHGRFCYGSSQNTANDFCQLLPPIIASLLI